jgi:hypothetical protein
MAWQKRLWFLGAGAALPATLSDWRVPGTGM